VKKVAKAKKLCNTSLILFERCTTSHHLLQCGIVSIRSLTPSRLLKHLNRSSFTLGTHIIILLVWITTGAKAIYLTVEAVVTSSGGLHRVHTGCGSKGTSSCGALVSSTTTSATPALIDVMGVHVQMPHRHAPCLLLCKTYRVQAIVAPKVCSRGTPCRATCGILVCQYGGPRRK
jgi:hypothetical protein